MKSVFVVRHAKSDWSSWGISDHDRPLNERGERDAPLMAQALNNRVKNIEYFICSTAVRARQTFDHFQSACQLFRGEHTHDLYHSDPATILRLIKQTPDDVNSVILFAHNPGLTELYNYFSGNFLDNLPTCGVFELISNASDWKSIASHNTHTGFLFYPKSV